MNLGYILPPLIAGIIGLVLSFVVIRSNYRSAAHRFFAGFLLAIAGWALVIFAMRVSPDLEHALLWDRPVIPLAAAGAVFYLHFTIRYTGVSFPRWLILLAYTCLLLLVVLAPTNLLIAGMQIMPYGYSLVPGILFFPAIFLQYFWIGLAGANLVGAYKKAPTYEERNRYIYLMLAMLLFLVLTAFDFLAVIGLPVYPGAIIGNIVFCSLTAFAILKYNLLDIRIAIRKGTAYILMSTAVALFYVGIIILFSQVFEGTVIEPWLYLLLLFILAFVLQPLWLVIQRLVDRWFYRERYNYLKALETFSWHTQSLTDSAGLGSTMVNLIAGALRTSVVCLFLPLHQSEDFATAFFAGMKKPTPNIILRSQSPLVKWLKRSNSMLSDHDLDTISQLQSVSPKEKEELRQIGAKFIVPLKTRLDQLAGVLILGQKLSDQPYTIEDKQLIYTLSSQMTVNLENVRLYNDALQARESLETWLNSMTDCVIIVNADHAVQFMNQAALENFGSKNGEICWNTLGKDTECPDCPIWHHPPSNKEESHQVINIRDREYDVATTPLLNPDGSLSVIEVLRDTTERRQMEDALRESEERYRMLAENATDVIWTVDMNMRLTYISPSVTHLLGYSAKEAMSKTMEEVFTPASFGVAMKALAEELAIENMDEKDLSRSRTLEVELNRKDGSVVPVEIKCSFLREPAGRPAAILVIARDIAERRRAEAELRFSNAAFTSIQESVVATDTEYIITNWNEVSERIYGIKASEAIGKKLLDVIEIVESAPGETAERVRKLETDGYYRDELLHRTKCAEVWISVSVQAIEDSGKRHGWVALATDVTERRQMEDALRESEEKYRELAESISDVFFAMDGELRYTYWNKASEKLTGISARDALGRHIYDISPDSESTRRAVKVYKKALATKQPQHFIDEYQLGGRDFFFDISAYPSRDGLSVFVRDVTDQKRIDVEKKEMEQKAQLASRLATVGEMASGVAHEINNPLTGVIGFAQLLMQKDIPEDIGRHVKIIADNAERVASIIRRLLTFARRYKPERTFVDVNGVLENTLNLRAYELKTSNIRVTTQLQPDLPRTLADGGQLQQVFLNIIMNAETEMKLAHGRGNLSINTETIAQTIRISFEDDGPGIAKENLHRIFDPFFTTREVGQGTGLGLSVCHGIVTQHDGRIYARSEPGKGATFMVELPVITAATEPKTAQLVSEQSNRIFGAKTLVVDDEPAVQQFLGQILSKDGHEVETVDNATEALRRIKSERYDLILLDIKLPGMSGTELYKHIQSTDRSLANRVVFITGDIMGKETMEFLSETKAHVIAKPFDTEDLKNSISDVLGKNNRVE